MCPHLTANHDNGGCDLIKFDTATSAVGLFILKLHLTVGLFLFAFGGNVCYLVENKGAVVFNACRDRAHLQISGDWQKSIRTVKLIPVPLFVIN